MKKAKYKQIEQLVKLAKQYDRSAQTELYNQYAKAMYNTSLRIVKDSYIAEDVMQEAFIEAFLKIRQFKSDSTFGAWLKRIVINRAINFLKKENQLKEIAKKTSELPSEDENPYSDITVGDIKACLPHLPKNYALVFNLYLIEGYDHEEIAEILDISSATSRSQLSRAKQKMREILNTLNTTI